MNEKHTPASNSTKNKQIEHEQATASLLEAVKTLPKQRMTKDEFEKWLDEETN